MLITHAYHLGWGRGGKERLREQEGAGNQEGPCGRRLAGGAMGHLLGGTAHTWPDPGTVATLIQTNQENSDNQENPKKLGWKGLELPLCAREPRETAERLCAVSMSSAVICPSPCLQGLKITLASGYQQRRYSNNWYRKGPHQAAHTPAGNSWNSWTGTRHPRPLEGR